MTFTQLLAQLGAPGSKTRVQCDSRLVARGDVFVAVQGTSVNGHDFIDQAVANGAAFIVSREPRDCKDAEMILVQDPGRSLGLLAQASMGNPSAKLTNLAVTGTNGKTTVSFLVRSIIQTAGQKCGLMGTIVYDTTAKAGVENATLTTPDAIEIARIARETVQAGAKFMVIEASSHSLSQHRLAGINFTAAAFTNLTGDHLDYHKTTGNYLAAKVTLFEQLPIHATAILNKQSPASGKIADKIRVRTLWYGIDAEADIVAQIESMDVNQSVYRLEFGGQRQFVTTRLIGKHNISNHLAAAGLCIAAGFDLPTIAAGLSALKAVPGRLEPVECEQPRPAGIAVLIDYAHTDDALKNVLNTLAPLCRGRLTVVFGCGGDRDRTKRPRMAEVAEQLADSVIITSDNPRTEQPGKIIEDIVAGLAEPDSEKITIEPDRRKAIELAIKTAQRDDIILIAGKGHETYQIVGTEKFDFDDKVIAEDFLRTI